MSGRNLCFASLPSQRLDMTELLQQFDAAGIRYLLIGGQAMRMAGMPRSTMDWDFFIPPRDEANLSLLNQVLADELDMPLIALGPAGQNFMQTYQTSYGVLQFHLLVPGVPRFDEAEKAAVVRKTENAIPVKCLSGTHLLAAKQAANRPQDQVDIEFLLELKNLGKL
jgi:hypothetical protein